MEGRKCYVIDENSMYYGEWGTIILVDDDKQYHVAIANGTATVPLFDRKQLRIPRKKEV